MNKQALKRTRITRRRPESAGIVAGLVALILLAAGPLPAQQGQGGGRRTSTGSTAQYPRTGAIGDAYYSIDPETRRVVVISDEETSRAVSQVLSNLDRPKPQVLIKVVFLEVTLTKGLDFGIEGGWTKPIGNGMTPNASDVFGLSALNSAPSNSPVNALGQPLSSFSPNASQVAPGSAGLYQILGPNYQVTLRAIAANGNAKVLSRPSILARNNQPAQIVVGQQVPIITSVSYNGLTGTPVNAVQYQNVGVILTVTPFITSDDTVEMIVNPQVSSIDTTTSIPISLGVNAPVIDTRSANTVAVTPNGQTIILGGLIHDSKLSNVTKIPLLGDIPGLGVLFRRTVRQDTKTELLIFLTPHIIETPTQLVSLTKTEREKSDVMKSLKQEELEQFLDSLPTVDSKPSNGKSR